MSNYPDDFNAAADDARYAQADCLVDDWHKDKAAVAAIFYGVGAAYKENTDHYGLAIEQLDAMRDQAFGDCTCGRCADSKNFATDGESLINDAMVSA